jgi:hypothetical protein
MKLYWLPAMQVMYKIVLVMKGIGALAFDQLKKKSYHVHWKPELFRPGHFVGLGLRLKSEIRTRTRART